MRHHERPLNDGSEILLPLALSDGETLGAASVLKHAKSHK
jgi:hypothetical protein